MSGPQTLPYFPPSFAAGDTILYRPRFTNYPSSLWVGKLYLSFGILAPIEITGVFDGDDYFLFTVPAATTANVTPGQWRWTVKVNNGTQYETPLCGQGVTNILPNFALQQAPTAAQLLLDAINAAIIALMANPLQSTNFNGQSMSYKDMNMLRQWQVQAQAAVLREQQAIDRARGGQDPGRIHMRFDPCATQSGLWFGWPWTVPYR